jgi:predicted CoA-substrate-specific enzyme activase
MRSSDNDSSGYRRAVVGVDIGSSFSKAVILSGGTVLSWAIIPSVGSYRAVADEVMKRALAGAGVTAEDIAVVSATGYGAASVASASQSSSDLSCQGRGIAYLFPSARTVIDIGAQFTRAFRLDGAGHVTAFVLSEKCAGGSGRLLAVIARVLQVDLNEMDRLAQKSKKKVDFTTSCAVFTESEVVSRIAEGESREDIAAGVYRALAAKAQSLVERLKFAPDCALAGGGAKNTGLVKGIEEGIGVDVLVPDEPQLVAALGAALMAEDKVAVGKSRS